VEVTGREPWQQTGSLVGARGRLLRFWAERGDGPRLGPLPPWSRSTTENDDWRAMHRSARRIRTIPRHSDVLLRTMETGQVPRLLACSCSMGCIDPADETHWAHL
jgi:hypothetical protein